MTNSLMFRYLIRTESGQCQVLQDSVDILSSQSHFPVSILRHSSAAVNLGACFLCSLAVVYRISSQGHLWDYHSTFDISSFEVL